jgi:urocanate hydratase
LFSILFSIINWINADLQQHNNTPLKNDFSRTNTTRNSFVLPKQNPTKQISRNQNAKKSFRLKKKNWHYAMPYGILNRNITELIQEFSEELKTYGRIYMYRLRPDYEMRARPLMNIRKSEQAKAIMLMIQNNLAVAQHPHELITYGGNGAVFQNWDAYLLTMQYLSEMTEEQT